MSQPGSKGHRTAKFPVSEPFLDEKEIHCVNDALAKRAISGFFGDYLPMFENEFSNYSDCKYGVATTSGTTALHLALATLSIREGDEVLVSTLTNMATFFSILYQGARPIPVDVDPVTLNIDPSLLKGKLSSRTRAILVVHLFGHPCDMDPIVEFARQHGLYVIEDSAEAHGATYNGRKVGGIGDIGCFSFYANKIITTGEGGMLTTNNSEWADKARSLRSLAFGDKNKFMHKDIGYNYRMTNIQAAIGHAQFGKIEEIIAAKRGIAARYTSKLSGRDDLVLPVEMPYARNVFWMYHLMLGPNHSREDVMRRLSMAGIETREGFVPYNMQEIFLRRGWTTKEECPVANEAAVRGFYLPSGPALGAEQVDYIADELVSALEGQ